MTRSDTVKVSAGPSKHLPAGPGCRNKTGVWGQQKTSVMKGGKREKRARRRNCRGRQRPAPQEVWALVS